jgi:hypothetical protein
MTIMKQVMQFQYNISHTNDTNIYFMTETQEFRHFRRVIPERTIQNTSILRLFYYTCLQDISGVYTTLEQGFYLIL